MWLFTPKKGPSLMTAQYFWIKHSAQNVHSGNAVCKIGILTRNVLYENLCRTEVLNMSRLLKDCPQQHSLPGVLLYDQIESVTLVDAKWTQSVQTPNPVALTEFPGRIWPLLVVFKAADRGMTQEVMICRVKMFCCWWSFKPTVARDQIHNIVSEHSEWALARTVGTLTVFSYLKD